MAIRDPKMHFRLFVAGLLINLSIGGAAFIWAGSSADSALHTKKYNRKTTTGELPNYGGGWHTIGNFEFGINNQGVIGPSYCPRGSDLRYLSVARWWFGGIIGRDTLVSAASSELHPGPRESDGVIHRSILKTSPDYHRDAVSEQDIICVFTDTITDIDIVGENPYENRPHIPLFIRIRHSTYAWSFDYAEDFILFDCWITNIGTHPIKKLFAGLRTAAQPVHRSVSELKWEAHVGFRRILDVPPGLCRAEDTVNIAWFADEDGDPTIYRQWDYRSLRAVMGFQILRPPPAEIITNFNWYVLEFGPRLAPTADDPYRPFAYPSAYPRIDVDRYYMLSHPEIDYDMMFAALNHSAEGFLPPGDLAEAAAIAGGTTGRYLFSFGPFDIEPGDSVPFTLAYIAGDNFHVNAWDYINYFDPFRPEIYYSKLDFSDLARNSRWARAIYDNPGVDTDGDGYRGESCWRYVWRDTTLADPADSFVVDSVRYFYTGDGVPDFRAVSPPPPVVRTRPGFGKVTLRWNGQESETTPDYFSEKIDFEGYRVYVAKNDRLSDFVLLAGYDIDDYIIYAFDPDNLR